MHSNMSKLHDACRNAARLKVMQRLAEQGPELVIFGRVPLHLACENRASLEVIQYLVEQWPESVQAMDRSEMLPLHIACANGASLAVIQYLVEQWPESVQSVDNMGWLPLHLCALRYDPSVLEEERPPRSSCFSGTSCKVGIRWCKASLDVVQYLVKQFSESVKTADTTRVLPVVLDQSLVKTAMAGIIGRSHRHE